MKLRYIDNRPISVNLRSAGGRFVKLPNPKIENIIECTDDEARVLLKRLNGTKPCYEIVETKTRRTRGPEAE